MRRGPWCSSEFARLNACRAAGHERSSLGSVRATLNSSGGQTAGEEYGGHGGLISRRAGSIERLVANADRPRFWP